MKTFAVCFFLLIAELTIAYPQFKTDTQRYNGAGASQIFTFGSDTKNVQGRVYGMPGPSQYGAGATYNNNGNSISLDALKIPGYGTIKSASATGQIYNDGNNKFSGTVFGGRYPRGAPYDVFGGNIDYSNRRGDTGKITYSNTPMINRQQIAAEGTYNLYKTPSSSLGLSGSYSRDIGKFQAPPNYGFGLNYNKRF